MQRDACAYLQDVIDACDDVPVLGDECAVLLEEAEDAD